MSEGQQDIINKQQQQAAEQVPKVGPPSKKINSYTYWVDDKNKSRQLPQDQRPKKIEPVKLETKPKEDGRSHWNTAGTWQHKNVPLTDVQKQYTEKINQWIATAFPEYKLKNVSLNGECQIVFIRQKKALTYEIKGKVEFQKKPQPQKQEQQIEQTEPEQKIERKNSSQGSDSQKKSDKSPDSSKSPQKPDKSPESNPSSGNQKAKKKNIKSKQKIITMTFEIVDLTDHGDRQYKSKGDNVESKKLISSKSQGLLVLLQQVLKTYK